MPLGISQAQHRQHANRALVCLLSHSAYLSPCWHGSDLETTCTCDFLFFVQLCFAARFCTTATSLNCELIRECLQVQAEVQQGCLSSGLAAALCKLRAL